MNRQRFAPGAGLTIREPTSNEQKKGNIMNPYRNNTGTGHFGPNSPGMNTADSAMDVKPPGSTQTRYPSGRR